MNSRLVGMLQVVAVIALLLATAQVFGGGADEGNASVLDARQLLSEQEMEREQAQERLSAEYWEVSGALLQTLGEAQGEFRTDRRFYSPLHCAILAVDAWQVVRADGNLLSMVDYELDAASKPTGLDVPVDYFYPAASALVHLRVDVRKVERAIEAAEDAQKLRILTWILLQREKEVERAKMTLTNAISRSHGADERPRIEKALELLDNPSDLLPLPWRSDHPSSK